MLTPLFKIASPRDVADCVTIARSRSELGRTIFFIGAGCSVSAGVPPVPEIAKRMVAEIAGAFSACPPGSSPAVCYSALLEKERLDLCLVGGTASAKTGLTDDDIDWYRVYDNCFERHLKAPDDIRSVFARMVDECDGAINWAHLCLGELVAQRYISTVLTTNFDQLVLTGIANAGLLPVVCDGLESLNRISPAPTHPQLVEIHGSRHTYRLRNRPEEVADVAAQHGAISAIIGLFNYATTFVAVGYGGREAGVMDLLIEAAKAYPDKNLFWVTFGSPEELGEKVRTFLSHSSNSAVVPNQDADTFFLSLCQEMAVGSPSAVRKPLARYDGVIRSLRKSRFEHVDIGAEVSRAAVLLNTLVKCEETFRKVGSSANIAADIRELRLAGRYREALETAQRLLGPAGSAEAEAAVLVEYAQAASSYASELMRTNISSALEIINDAVVLSKRASESGNKKHRLLLIGTLRQAGATLHAAGRLGETRRLYEEALALASAVYLEEDNDDLTARELALCYHAIADVAIDLAEHDVAEVNLKKSLELRLQLLARKPDDLVTRHSVSVAYDRLGDLSILQEDAASAMHYFQLSHETDKPLLLQHPLDISLRRDSIVSHSKLGQAAVMMEDLTSARSAYEHALRIALELGENGDKTELRRHIAIIRSQLGLLEHKLGNLDVALEQHKAALAFFRDIVLVDPSSAEARRDLAVCLTSYGDVLRAKEDFASARTVYEEALAIDDGLAREEGITSVYVLDSAIDHIRVGEMSRELGDKDSSLDHLLKAQSILERRVEREGGLVVEKRALAEVLDTLGSLHDISGNEEQAVACRRRRDEIFASIQGDGAPPPI